MTKEPGRPNLSEEQLDFFRTFANFVGQHGNEVATRAAMESDEGFDLSVWRQLSRLGLPGLAIAEEYGGAGRGMTELSLVAEAAGATLLCAPILSSVVLATTLIAQIPDESLKRELLTGLAAGERRAAVALGESDRLGTGVVPTVAVSGRGRATEVNGVARFVLDGHTADDLLVLARGGAGATVLALVNGTERGVTRRRMRALDLTRAQAEITFEGAPATVLLDDADAAIARTLDVARVFVAAEQVGGAQRCLDLAVDYANTRVQYGRIIGSFQAIKHTCANMLVGLEGARATMIEAVRVADEDPENLPIAVSLAASVCSETYFQIASDALHVHGGIGFTWDHVSHLYFRRAKANELMFGTPAQHRERLLRVSGLAKAACEGGQRG